MVLSLPCLDLVGLGTRLDLVGLGTRLDFVSLGTSTRFLQSTAKVSVCQWLGLKLVRSSSLVLADVAGCAGTQNGCLTTSRATS
jgi:hypothetical protein